MAVFISFDPSSTLWPLADPSPILVVPKSDQAFKTNQTLFPFADLLAYNLLTCLTKEEGKKGLKECVMVPRMEEGALAPKLWPASEENLHMASVKGLSKG